MILTRYFPLLLFHRAFAVPLPDPDEKAPIITIKTTTVITLGCGVVIEKTQVISGKTIIVAGHPPTSKCQGQTTHTVSNSLSNQISHTRTFLPGGTPFTIGRTVISIGLSGVAVVGSKTIDLKTMRSSAAILTIDKQVITIHPTGFEWLESNRPGQATIPSQQRSTITPGSPPITLGTIPISVGRAGTLIVNHSTILIPKSSQTTIIVGGQTLEASQDGIILISMPISQLPQPTLVKTITDGTATFSFSTDFLSIAGLSTWSQTSTVIGGQSTVLPIWPCVLECGTTFNAVLVIPIAPLPVTATPLPAPFSFPQLGIGPGGRPTLKSLSSTPIPTKSLPTLPSLIVPTPIPTAGPTTPPTTASTDTADEEVTSTMTTVPSGFSIELATNTQWTTNTWITTVRDGSTTVVPVLVGCPGCGGVLAGLILWNLPHIPRISFHIPGFPKLPTFHLPCVKFFGIPVGKCNKPPVTGGGGNKDKPPPPPPKDPKPTGDKSKGNESTEKEKESSATASSSTSTCTASVASACSATTICQSGKTGSACSTTSTCSAIATACEVTGTTVEGTATAVPHIIYPSQGATRANTKSVQEVLESFFPGDEKSVVVIADKASGVSFWYAPLTPGQVITVKQTKLIGGISPRCLTCPGPSVYSWQDPQVQAPGDKSLSPKQKLGARDQGAIRAPGSREEVTFMNWEFGKSLSDYGGNFFYDASAGENIPVYIIDYGANLDSPEFDHLAGRARWLYPKLEEQGIENDESYNRHGTCMLSKVLGKTLGVAKKASPIIVRMSRGAKPERWLGALSTVSDDIGGYNPTGPPLNTRAILSLSWYYPKTGSDGPSDPLDFEYKMRIELNALVHQGVFIVAGSGNAGIDEITGYPASLAADGVPSLLVVGASTLEGAKWSNAFGGGCNTDAKRRIPSVYAPGYRGMMCAAGARPAISPTPAPATPATPEPTATPIPVPLYRESGGGTSPATAAVAGLAAYFLGLSSIAHLVKTPALMKSYIESKAWPRTLGSHVLCAYNNYHFKPEDLQCPIQARAENSLDGQCSPPPDTKEPKKPTSTNPDSSTINSSPKSLPTDMGSTVQSVPPTTEPPSQTTSVIPIATDVSIPTSETVVQIKLMESFIGIFSPDYQEYPEFHWVVYSYESKDLSAVACTSWTQEFDDKDIGPTSSITQDTVPFPSTGDMGFVLPQLSNGKSGCTYRGTAGLAGTVECDDKSVVQCNLDKVSLLVESCEPSGKGDERDYNLYPKVVCVWL